MAECDRQPKNVRLQINEEDFADKQFKCCQTKTTKVLVCVNCGNVFHLSCAVKNKLKCNKICDTRISCCEQTQQGSCNDKVNTNDLLLNEIEFLKKLLKEKEDKYNIIVENNSLLKQNLNLLQQTQTNVSAKKNANQTIYKKQVAESIELADISRNAKNKINVNKNSPRLQDLSNISERINFNEQNLESMESITNINVLTEEQQTQEKDFKIVTHKKNRIVKKNFGDNELNKDFGAQKRVWLYLYRVKRHVTTEKITEHLKCQESFRSADIIIKELPTNESQNKCFMCGVDFSLKDEIYNPSTWPKSVAYKRFDFRKFNKYESRKEDF